MALRLSLSAGRLCVFYGRSLASISQALARGFASDENSSNNNNNNDINNNNNSGGSSNSAENGEDDTTRPIALRRGSYSCDILLKPDHRAPLPGRVGVAPGRDRPVASRKLLSTPLAPPVRRGAELIAELLEDRHTSALVTYLSPLADQLSRGGASRPTAGGHTVGETAAAAAGGREEEEQLLQICAHNCPDLLKREFSPLFTERDISSGDLTVLVVNQRTTHDSVLWSEPMEQERAELATQFLSVARDVTLRLRRLGFWADLIDPRSGRPHLSAFLPIQRAAAPPTPSAPPSSSPPAAGAGAGSDVLLETDERMALLGFHIEDLGCCRVVRHADWGSHVFIGCMFTNAPLSDARLTDLLKMYDHLPAAPATPPAPVAAAAPATPPAPAAAVAPSVLSDDE